LGEGGKHRAISENDARSLLVIVGKQ